MGENRVKSLLEKPMNQMAVSKDYVLLIVARPEDFGIAIDEVLDFLTSKEKMSGIYVSLNKPFETVSRSLENKGINLLKLYFIDGSGVGGKKGKNVSYIQNAGSLTELSLVLSEISASGKYDFLLMDSISTLLIYNYVNTTEKFFHYLSSKMRSMNVKELVMVLDDESSRKILPTLGQFSDTTVSLHNLYSQ